MNQIKLAIIVPVCNFFITQMKKKIFFFKRYIASNSDVYTGTVVVLFFHLLHTCSNLLRITFVSSMLCVIASTCVITSIVPFLALHVGHTFVHTETYQNW